MNMLIRGVAACRVVVMSQSQLEHDASPLSAGDDASIAGPWQSLGCTTSGQFDQDPLPCVRHFDGEDHVAVNVGDLRQGSTGVVIPGLRHRVDASHLEVPDEASSQVRDQLERRICELALLPGASRLHDTR